MIDVAINLKNKNFSPLLLNMADIKKPGGIVEEGGSAQEECCFRRSDYHKHLMRTFYPLVGVECIYSYDVEYCKENEKVGNKPLEKSTNINMIAIAALRFPSVNRTMMDYTNKSDEDIMYKKIEMIFKIGLYHNHDVLVLSAFGCGAYGNPSKKVVSIFKEVLKKYDGYFKIVIFPILGENYNIFKNLQN